MSEKLCPLRRQILVKHEKQEKQSGWGRPTDAPCVESKCGLWVETESADQSIKGCAIAVSARSLFSLDRDGIEIYTVKDNALCVNIDD